MIRVFFNGLVGGGSHRPETRACRGVRRLRKGGWLLAVCLASSLLWTPGRLAADSFVINTPGGPVTVEVTHIGPEGNVTGPSEPTPPGFRPPTIFSAPLPTGSGARALGLSGAFTAVADDATAASWNPAGLIQLERSEASAVFRASRETEDHYSEASDYRVGEDDFSNTRLNYLSVVCPFQYGRRNWVFSVNYQEAYDFTQEFTADMTQMTAEPDASSSSSTYRDVVTANYRQDGTVTQGAVIDINVTSDLTTHRSCALRQITSSDALTDLEFEQSGTIDATTEAIALELTPSFSIGAAVNYYRDSLIGGPSIRSRTTARYSGRTVCSAVVEETSTTTGTYSYDGTIHLPPSGTIPVPIDVPISGSGSYPAFSDSATSHENPNAWFDGEYTEINEYESLNGWNGTLGALWCASRHLSLGFGLDLPWTAEGTQTKTVRHEVTTYDSSHSTVMNVSSSERVMSEDVKLDFPLYWSVGAVWRWSQQLHTSLDASQTRWSDFAFRAGGERINPLDGSDYGENKVDDCWSCRLGAEYLWVLTKTEVPFRAGASWEQRPAIDRPDEYWGVSLGTGLSIGRDPGKVIIDLAYLCSWADDVLGTLVPDQQGLGTDVRKHQVYLSGIYHF